MLYSQILRKHLTIVIKVTEWFKQGVGVRQGCIHSPDFFNLVLEYIMIETLEEIDEDAKIN